MPYLSGRTVLMTFLHVGTTANCQQCDVCILSPRPIQREGARV